MKKIYIYLLMLLLTSGLYSQQLRLPDEEIIGRFAATPDSLEIRKDYSEFYNVHEAERLLYRAILENDFVRTKEEYHPFFYAYLRGNTTPLMDFRLGFLNPDIPLINIYAEYYREEIDDLLSEKVFLEWRPDNLPKLPFFYPAIYLQGSYSVVNIDDPYSSSAEPSGLFEEFTMSTFGFSTKTVPVKLQYFNSIFFKSRFLFGFNDEVEESSNLGFFEWSGKATVESPELELNINLPKYFFLEETDINVYNYYYNSLDKNSSFEESFHFAANFYVPLPFLNLFALNVQYSDFFMPSILFEKSFYLNEISEFAISNFPYLDVPSLYDYHEEYPFIRSFKDEQDYSEKIKYAQQVPLNASIKFSLFRPVELQIYLNSMYVMNKSYVNAYETKYDHNPSWVQRDMLLNSINLDIVKKIDNVTLGFKTKFLVSDVSIPPDSGLDYPAVWPPSHIVTPSKLPWEPHFEATASVAYRYKKYTIGLTGEALMLRYDVSEFQMDDLFLLSNTHNFDISRNFKLSINLNNILNKEYEKIYGLPSAGFNAEAVVRMQF